MRRSWPTRRLLVTGGRKFGEHDDDLERRVSEALYDLLEVRARCDITVIHGACPTGVDRITAEACEAWGLPVEPHPAEWDSHGDRAGPIRNAEMVSSGADRVARFPGGAGTADCERKARAAGIPIVVLSLR